MSKPPGFQFTVELPESVITSSPKSSARFDERRKSEIPFLSQNAEDSNNRTLSTYGFENPRQHISFNLSGSNTGSAEASRDIIGSNIIYSLAANPELTSNRSSMSIDSSVGSSNCEILTDRKPKSSEINPKPTNFSK